MHASRSRSKGAAIAVIGIAVLMLAAGCSRERQDWRSAEAADTIESYDQFLTRHPQGELAAKARERVAQLAEERDWQRASTADTLEAYQQFMVQHPQGKWAQEARIRLENFAIGETLPTTGVAEAAKPGEPASTEPAPAPQPARAAPATIMPPRTVAPARATSPADGDGRGSGFAVQLGAFSDEARARSEWQRLARTYASELGSRSPRYARAQTNAGKLVRLQASATSEADARSVCGALKGRGQACVVVLP
jgi:cell division septation protein DedD